MSVWTVVTGFRRIAMALLMLVVPWFALLVTPEVWFHSGTYQWDGECAMGTPTWPRIGAAIGWPAAVCLFVGAACNLGRTTNRTGRWALAAGLILLVGWIVLVATWGYEVTSLGTTIDEHGRC